jgi:hypothetical protein
MLICEDPLADELIYRNGARWLLGLIILKPETRKVAV